MTRTLVTYVYYENDISKLNFDFFVQNGIRKKNDVHYNIIVKSDKCSIQIPKLDNITVYKTKNIGRDFYGFGYSINQINKDDFDKFIFMNDTVIGPFLPTYLNKTDWINYYTSHLSEKIKMIGSTKNNLTTFARGRNITPHIQSMIFAVDKIGLNILINNNKFNLDKLIELQNDRHKYIDLFEVGASKVIQENGYQIKSLLQVEQSSNSKDLRHGDIHYQGKYFGSSINPIETMFIKTYRFCKNNKILNKDLYNYIRWSLNEKTLKKYNKIFNNKNNKSTTVTNEIDHTPLILGLTLGLGLPILILISYTAIKLTK